jgi:putative ABC transport system permease protein
MLHSLLRDLRLAVRALGRRPAFSAIALGTLALGIGANTAVFSVVNSVLIERLPYREPERLVTFGGTFISNAELLYLQERIEGFSRVASYSPGWGMALTSAGEPTQLTAAKVSANFLRTIGVVPMIGRDFSDDEAVPGKDAVALLDYRFWQERFGADVSILGKAITVEGRPHTVVGVLPRGFHFYSQTPAHLIVPIAMDPAAWYHRGQVALAVARLAPGVTASGVEAEVRSHLPAIRAAFSYGPDHGQNLRVMSLTDFVVGPVRTILLLLLGAVGFIVMIAAANVGNLLLVRASERRREAAVRAALGAGRWQIVRGMAAESTVLALGGSAIGLALAFTGVAVLRAILPADTPRLAEVAINGRVLGACLLVAVAAALLGALPAVAATRADPQGALGSVRASAGTRGSGRLRGALVSVEVALALVLVTGAALMVTTLWRLSRVDPGFQPERVLSFRLQPTARMTGAQLPGYFDRMIDQVRALPGVTAAGGIHHLPMSGYNWWANIEVEGRPLRAGEVAPRAGWRIIAGDYLRAMGIRLVAGRTFEARDDAGAERVVLINDVLARQLFPGLDPVGRRIQGGNATRNAWSRIVGVVTGVRHESLDQAPAGELYLPFAQAPVSFITVVARASTDPGALGLAAERVIRRGDATVAIAERRALGDVVAGSNARRRVVLRLLLAFAGVGLVLGMVGIYGIVSYAAAQRTREIGVRIALGAGHRSIVSMVVAHGLRYTAIGLAAGMVAALWLTRGMRGVVYGVSTSDPAIYAIVVGVMVAVSLLASWVPARRAARIDPIVAMRSDG